MSTAEEKYRELRRITWAMILSCRRVMITLPAKARISLLDDVMRAEAELERLQIAEDAVRKPARGLPFPDRTS